MRTWILILCCLVATYGFPVGVMGIVVGLFTGPQILVPGLVHFSVASIAFIVFIRVASADSDGKSSQSKDDF
ncbi:MAG: hypothetical protein ABI557_01760, partial [Aureliella sp.]